MGRALLAALSLIVLGPCCSPPPPASPDADSSTSARTAPSAATGHTPAPLPGRTAAPTPQHSATPRPAMDARAAMRDIVHLADDIGPREATSRNFAEAAAFVETRFERLGYHVRRTNVRVPAGNSWGTPVRRGTSVNVIAQPKGFDASESYVVVG